MKLFDLRRPYFIIFILLFGVLVARSERVIGIQENQPASAAVSNPAKKINPYLDCWVLHERMADFLNYHYVFNSFTPELSKRVFGMYFKLLDPGKLYFLQSDIDSFKSYATRLGSQTGCGFINSVYARYKQRVEQATAIARSINSKPISFTQDEFLETDRKKIVWAKTPEELQERWRKTLKFILLNMDGTDTPQALKKRLLKRYGMFEKDVLTRSQDEINSIFLNAFALSLDPHSSFLTPVDNAQFQIDFSLKLVGIGATLMNNDGYTTVDAVVPGGAAAKDGRLKKGDKIVAVDSGDGSGLQDVIDMDLSKVVQLIRGKENTVVQLVLMRKEPDGQIKRLQIALTRAVVQIKDSEAKSDIFMIGDKKIGVINLPSFYIDYEGCQKNPFFCRSSSNDMAREIRKLKEQKVDGIVVDLRKNGGGDLSEAEKIVGLFIKNPVVTQVEDRDRQVRPLEIEALPLYTGPLALLVSRYSASASEIFSGAVQDYGRGLIVGDTRTFGKGTVQTVVEIPSTSKKRQTDGAIHVTIAKFFRPSGKSNQEKGVLSDVVIPDPIDATDVGEKDYDYALPYTVISAAPDFKPEQNLSGFLPKLQEMSAARVKKTDGFQKIMESIAKLEKEKNNTLVSLKKSGEKKIDGKADGKNGKPRSDEDNPDALPDFSVKVIQAKDVGLKEAAFILLDAIRLTGKADWTR